MSYKKAYVYTIKLGYYNIIERKFIKTGIQNVEVAILGETEKSYKIRLLQPSKKYDFGYIMWVRKRNIKLRTVQEHSKFSSREIVLGDIRLYCDDYCTSTFCNICPLKNYDYEKDSYRTGSYFFSRRVLGNGRQ